MRNGAFCSSFLLLVGTANCYWLEKYKNDHSTSIKIPTYESPDDLGKFELTAGAQTLNSGFISASVDEYCPSCDEDGDINVINCYTNCVDVNGDENLDICEENFFGLVDDKPRQNSMVEKNAFDHEVDPLLGVFPDYWVTMKSQCEDLTDEEYEMFKYKEYSWGHFGRSSKKPGKMIIRHFDNLGVYFFSERFSFEDNDSLQPESKRESEVRGRVADLLFGFPSFKVPETSESFFWWLKGDYFGGEHIVNGEWSVAALKNIAREGEGLDAGPVMLVHKNEKDVIIISPASMSSFNMYQDDWIYAKDNAYSMLMEAAARLKFKSPDIDETCFVEQLDLEFGSSRGSRDHIAGAYEEFVKKRDNGEYVPFESMTILVTSNQGPRAAIAKWGEMIQVFGQLGIVDCPCPTFCNKYNNKDIFPQQKKAMYSTSVGSYYDGLIKRSELDELEKQQEMTEELIELGREVVSGSVPVLVNYFNLGDWWSDQDEFGLKKFLNNRDNIWGPPKREPPNIESLEGCDRWGTAALYYELNKAFNNDFNMDCEYGFPTAKLETVPLIQDKDACARIESSARPDKIHQEKHAKNKQCWNVKSKGDLDDPRIPCPYREECNYGGITLASDKNYWSALPMIKFYNTRTYEFDNDRYAGCSQMTIRYSKEVLNQHCRPNLQIGAGEEWIYAMHDGLSAAAVADGIKPSRGIGMTLANASPRIGIYAGLLSHVHSLEVTAPFNFDYSLTGLFASALGLRPMTGPVLSGNYETLDNFEYKKVDAEFQIAAATLSMGPVRFGDQKGNFNWNILSKCCRNDGVILKPDAPAAPIDADLAGLGNRQSGLGKGEEIRWQTYAEIEMELFDGSDTENDMLTNNYVLLHKTSSQFALPLATLRGANANTEFYYIQTQPTASNACFIKKSSETFNFAQQSEYSLTTFAETTLLKNKKFAFIGDLSKIVGISSQRFKKFVNNNNGGSFTFSTLPTSANLVEGVGPLGDDRLELSACYDGELIQPREYFFVKYNRDANFSFNADSKGFRCDSPDTCYKASCSCPDGCTSCYDIPSDDCATRWDSCESEVPRNNNCPDGTFIESAGTEDGFQCAAEPKCVGKDECIPTTTAPPTTTEPPTTTTFTTTTVTTTSLTTTSLTTTSTITTTTSVTSTTITTTTDWTTTPTPTPITTTSSSTTTTWTTTSLTTTSATTTSATTTSITTTSITTTSITTTTIVTSSSTTTTSTTTSTTTTTTTTTTTASTISKYFIQDTVATAENASIKEVLADLERLICEETFNQCSVSQRSKSILFITEIESVKSKDHVVAIYNNAFEFADNALYPSLNLADHSDNIIICETNINNCAEVEYPKDPMSPGTVVGVIFGAVTGTLLVVYLVVAFLWPKWGWKWLLPRGKSKTNSSHYSASTNYPRSNTNQNNNSGRPPAGQEQAPPNQSQVQNPPEPRAPLPASEQSSVSRLPPSSFVYATPSALNDSSLYSPSSQGALANQPKVVYHPERSLDTGSVRFEETQPKASAASPAKKSAFPPPKKSKKRAAPPPPSTMTLEIENASFSQT